MEVEAENVFFAWFTLCLFGLFNAVVRAQSACNFFIIIITLTWTYSDEDCTSSYTEEAIQYVQAKVCIEIPSNNGYRLPASSSPLTNLNL